MGQVVTGIREDVGWDKGEWRGGGMSTRSREGRRSRRAPPPSHTSLNSPPVDISNSKSTSLLGGFTPEPFHRRPFLSSSCPTGCCSATTTGKERDNSWNPLSWTPSAGLPFLDLLPLEKAVSPPSRRKTTRAGRLLEDSEPPFQETRLHRPSSPLAATPRPEDRFDIADPVRAFAMDGWILQAQKAISSLNRRFYSMYTGEPTKGKVCDFDVIDAVHLVLSMSGELRRALYASSAVSLDLELFLPDLVGNTEILTEDHRKQLCRHLPARAEGYVWTLMFSTSQHGFSLNSMYRKMTRLESPILMVIQDTDNNVFGALTSCALKVSDHFYGTGESLLFRFAPECQVYNWTGDNMYFIKGNNESLAIGAGDGKFGLWLDGDLNQGRTEPCSTYGNEPLTPSQDFVVKTVECWAFV